MSFIFGYGDISQHCRHNGLSVPDCRIVIRKLGNPWDNIFSCWSIYVKPPLTAVASLDSLERGSLSQILRYSDTQLRNTRILGHSHQVTWPVTSDQDITEMRSLCTESTERKTLFLDYIDRRCDMATWRCDSPQCPCVLSQSDSVTSNNRKHRDRTWLIDIPHHSAHSDTATVLLCYIQCTVYTLLCCTVHCI